MSEHPIHRSAPVLFPAVQKLRPGDCGFPAGAVTWRVWCEGEGFFESCVELSSVGASGPLLRPTIGLVCSRHCPGTIVLETYALIRRLPVHGPTVVGGFHSPMEKTCFESLLLRHIPVVYCPGRRLRARGLSLSWNEAIADQRLLLLSPFTENKKRVDRILARMRNMFVAAIADRLFIPHARPGGDVISLARMTLAHGKQVLTLADPANEELMRAGAEGRTAAGLYREMSRGVRTG